MLQINKDITNTLLFTATESCVLANPYFLFKFTNRTTNDIIYYVATDTSLYNYRFNKATIQGSLFSVFGYYTYEIYEQLSSTNIDPTGLNLVESGFMVVVGDSFTPDEYDGQDNTFVV